jgi:hypothetical protein
MLLCCSLLTRCRRPCLQLFSATALCAASFASFPHHALHGLDIISVHNCYLSLQSYYVVTI